MPSEAVFQTAFIFLNGVFANLQTILLVIKLRLIICRLKVRTDVG
ncbi:hypothetical protein NEIPOLOT_01721 [Neisseria polysaccharea ATCC 43768]|nr:hypothetical protein NEIPOLOT_01721 [Neisseria polysaccharea ATCC 43768]